MKKIVLLGPAHPLRGGLASYNERLAHEFQTLGDEVEMVTFSLQYPDFLFPGKTQFSTDPPPKDLKIKVLVNSINPLNWIRIGWQLRQQKPDLIICRFWLPFMSPCLGTILRIAQTNRHTRSVALIDNIIPHEKRIGDRLFARYFVGAVERFVVMSKSVEAELRQFTTSKQVDCVPHPIFDNYGDKVAKAESRQFLGLAEAGRYVLFFGFIRKYKGLDLLLEALADPRVAALGIKAVVAGEYYDSPTAYLELIAEKGLEKRVILKDDFIPNDEVRYYFGAADVVVQPYKTATQSGISQLAYHFEKPMIVTDVGGLPEIVSHEKSGFVVPVSVQAIADAIVRFYTENKEAAFVEGTIENKKRFSWQRMAETLKKFGDDDSTF